MHVEKTKTFGVVLLAQLMRRYVMYHVKLLTEIGQSCFPANEKDSSYIRVYRRQIYSECDKLQKSDLNAVFVRTDLLIQYWR